MTSFLCLTWKLLLHSAENKACSHCVWPRRMSGSLYRSLYQCTNLGSWLPDRKKNEEIWRLARKRFVFFTYLKLQIKCVCVYSWLTSKVGMVSSGFLLTFSLHPLVWCYWVQQVILAGFKTALFIQSDAIRGNTLCCIVSSNRRFVDL